MIREGQIVISKAGRDINRKFVILKIIDENYVLISDGRLRKIDKPKLKKNKHLQKTNSFIDLEELYKLNDSGQKNAYLIKHLNIQK